MKTALLIGNTDGIGRAVTDRLLLDDAWQVVGISRRESDVEHERYDHHVCDVRDAAYPDLLSTHVVKEGPPDLCIYFAGIGHGFDLDDLAGERQVLEVNLIALARTVEAVIPSMVEAGRGHLIGLSSIADVLIIPDGFGYAASKAGMTGYLNGLALALRKATPVRVTNIRFGFVDTKMADAPMKPMMIDAGKAARLVMKCVRTRPIQFTYPKPMNALAWLIRAGISIRVWFS
jgi:NAD(P)-dependent dehydrogenase (short-subunit alcohol dehydrogenase family)